MFETICSTLGSLGHEVKVSDLHRMNFDPVSSRRNFVTVKEPEFFKQQAEEEFATEQNGFAKEIESEIKKVEWCDLMIWQFPLWWFGLPAVLKGWVDRVFAAGRIHRNGRNYETGVFRGKRAVLSLTTGSSEAAFRPGGFNGDIAGILRPIHRGMTSAPRSWHARVIASTSVLNPFLKQTCVSGTIRVCSPTAAA